MESPPQRRLAAATMLQVPGIEIAHLIIASSILDPLDKGFRTPPTEALADKPEPKGTLIA